MLIQSLSTSSRHLYYQLLLIIIPLIVIPLVIHEEYIYFVLTTAYIQAIYAMSWNLLSSSGQVSLGHAGFFGIGAYTSVLMASNLGLSPWLTMLTGPILAGLVGAGLALLCVRLREWFLAMVTFGFALIVESLVVDQLGWLTNGWDGLTTPNLFPSIFNFRSESLYYIVLMSMLVTYFLTKRIFNSNFGLGLSAIRDNQLVANLSGINLTKYKLLAFVASSYLAGFAGALEAHTIGRFLSPEIFTSQNSFWPLVYSVGGGVGTPEGPILGAILIRLFWEWLRNLGGYGSMIIIGLILVLEVIFLPRGLFPILKKLVNRLTLK